MDPSFYKSVTTSRGLRYSYYAFPAQQGKPTLFFCHGFPSTSRDWRYIVPYFKDRDYGVIAPDMLGFGDTDKPTDPALYVSSVMSKDLVQILDAEKVDTAIAIGHDWGAKAISRLANYFPERFIAYAFFSVPYVAPRPGVDFRDWVTDLKKVNGFDTFGYWFFFAADDADSVMRSHIDTLISLVYPSDPFCWKERLAPEGAIRATLLEDWKAPLASYVTQEDVKIWKRKFLEDGFAAPTCWYKIMVNNMQTKDDYNVPPERALPPKSAPIFFAGGKQDCVCLVSVAHALFADEAFKDHHITIRDYDADHWLILSHADEITRELERWIENVVLKKVNF